MGSAGLRIVCQPDVDPDRMIPANATESTCRPHRRQEGANVSAAASAFESG